MRTCPPRAPRRPSRPNRDDLFPKTSCWAASLSSDSVSQSPPHLPPRRLSRVSFPQSPPLSDVLRRHRRSCRDVVGPGHFPRQSPEPCRHRHRRPRHRPRPGLRTPGQCHRHPRLRRRRQPCPRRRRGRGPGRWRHPEVPQAVGDLRRVSRRPASSTPSVVVATPNHWHAPAAILACAAGKHVYVEKPCSYNPREGELLVAAARRHQRKVQMGNQRRSYPKIKEAMEALPPADPAIRSRATSRNRGISTTAPRPASAVKFRGAGGR